MEKKINSSDSHFARYQEKIIRALRQLFPQVSIYLFGSRARKTNTSVSDIDLAIDTKNKLSTRQMRLAKEALDALNIPLSIDLVDINNIQEELRKKIVTEGTIWTD